MNQHEQVIIIGGGPAGAACAVQLKRYGINPLLLEKHSIGGLVKNAWRLDNYPGYPEGITGIDMAEKIRAHLKRFDIRYSICDIRYLKLINNQFVLEGVGAVYTCKYLVVASGTKPREIGEDIPQEYVKSIYSEVYPLRNIKGKEIDIVGAGDAAFDYAMTLSEHNIVHIHNRGTGIKCIPALQEITKSQPNIYYHENSKPSFSSDYTIFAVGREAELGFLSDEIINDQGKLEQDGLIYIVGDVKNGMVRQTSVAIGDGIRAAMAIREKMIEG
ncbi:MAG: NAD(P)/FAD-dependent oxidoreductase [Bacteroidota bacterium]